MLNAFPQSGRPMLRRNACAALAAAAAFVLSGCQSALSPDYQARDSNAYYQSLIAREVVNDRGLRQYARIDEPGTNPATLPASGTLNPIVVSASQVGLPWANL